MPVLSQSTLLAISTWPASGFVIVPLLPLVTILTSELADIRWCQGYDDRVSETGLWCYSISHIVMYRRTTTLA